MSITIPPQELWWLTRFFSGKNQLSWQSIESGQTATADLDRVIPWIKFINSPVIDRPLVLPLYGPNGPIAWYGMAIDDQMFCQLIDEISGFIGPSYSDFSGESWALSDTSEPELALKERFGNRVIRFSSAEPNNYQKIDQSLSLYRDLLSRRPIIPDRTQRPFGKIRRDFDLALLAGNAKHAQEFLDELIDSGRVDAEQRKYLEVRFLAGLGRKEELARSQPLISSIADLNLPRQTLVDVVDSLYETYIRPIETSLNVDEIVARFKQNISRSFGSLFKDRKGIRHATVLRAFLLFELVKDEPNVKRCDSILIAYPESAEGRNLIDRWVGLLQEKANDKPTVIDIPLLERARQAIADEDYVTASQLCFELLPQYWAYSALLRCAAELNSIDVNQKVFDALDAIPEDVLARFSPKDHSRFESLRLTIARSSNSSEIDSDWISWAQEVANGVTLTSAIAVLEENVTKWSIDDYSNDNDRCNKLAQLIGNASGGQEEIYRQAFPYLVEFFTERQSQSTRAFTPIYVNLIKSLGWSGALSPDELEIASSLVLALFATGPDLPVYQESIEDLCEIISANNSPIHLDWALNASELLVLYPAQDGGKLRLQFFSKVLSIVSSFPHRVTATQRDVLEFLAKDYGCVNLLESLPPPSDNEIDSHKHAIATEFTGLIGIYTLTEGAGQRAKCILKSYFPGIRVETNNDNVATDRLISLAKNSDIFVFAWKSSKHQAYYCVKEARQNKAILLPIGKGAASIIKSVLEYIAVT